MLRKTIHSLRLFIDRRRRPRWMHNGRWYVKYKNGRSLCMDYFTACDYAEMFNGEVKHISTYHQAADQAGGQADE